APGHGDQPLVHRAAGHLGDQAARAGLDRDAALLGRLDDALDLRRARPLGEVEDAHLARPRAHQLVDRPDAEDDALVSFGVAHTPASTSRTSSSNAAAGSGASRTGRPTTR